MMSSLKEINEHVLFHLALIGGVGPALTLKLIRCLAQKALLYDQLKEELPLIDLSILYSWTQADFQKAGCTAREAALLHEGLADPSLVEQEKKFCLAAEVSFIILGHAEYPQSLLHIPHPPLVLWYKGVWPSLAGCALVGSRVADAYGKKATFLFAQAIVELGRSVISGGARGIDTYAHQAALSFNGHTTAVFGSGISVSYPSENRNLFEKIVDRGGLLISPFSVRTQPSKMNFPMRNRIISGLSEMVVVVQAAQKSGALITAHMALEQGRTVAAVPGDIFSPLSAGCHALIKEGAIAATSPEVIFEEWGYQTNTANLPEKYEEVDIKDLLSPTVPLPLSTRLLRLLGNKAMPQETLPQTLEASAEEIEECLFNLHLEGKVEQTSPGMWTLI